MKKIIGKFLNTDESIALYIIGTATMTLVLQAFYDFANDPHQFQGGYIPAILSLIITITIIITNLLREKRKVHVITLDEEMKPKKRKGLILLVGPTEASNTDSIEYHLPELEHCWMIASSGARETIKKLTDKYRDKITHIYHGEPNYLVDPDLIKSTYDKLIHIIDVEAPDQGLARNQLIADITGGMKPMTAGMALACLARNLDMQYMKSQRDPTTGVPIGKAVPIKIDTDFKTTTASS